MTEKFAQWDSAEYLKTEEDMSEYLNACMEEAGTIPLLSQKRSALLPVRVECLR